MVNNWVENLKQVYDKISLQEEASKIGALIDIESFKMFSSTKTEANESSPSKRHMVNYKSEFHNESLASLHIQMLNIVLIKGVSL